MRHALKLSLAVVSLPLLLATQADAKVYELAKFKILSVSGARALTFTEDSGSPSGRCTGTTSARIGFRSTAPEVAYLNVRRIHGRRKIVVSDKAKPPQAKYVLMDGEATVSRSVDYEATAGCGIEPSACPEATVPAAARVFGTDVKDAGVGADPDVGGDPDCGMLPFTPWGSSRFEPQTAFSDLFSWSEIFGKKKRLEGTSRVEAPLSVEFLDEEGDSLSGLRADETTIVMKRLKLEKDLQDRR